MVAPPGWPSDLPPPGTPQFESQVIGWLFDRVPGGWRSHPVLRANGYVLATLAVHHAAAELAGLRTAYTAARRQLHEHVQPQVLDDVLVALEAEGATANETLREIELVTEALEGKVWRPRL